MRVCSWILGVWWGVFGQTGCPFEPSLFWPTGKLDCGVLDWGGFGASCVGHKARQASDFCAAPCDKEGLWTPDGLLSFCSGGIVDSDIVTGLVVP